VEVKIVELRLGRENNLVKKGFSSLRLEDSSVFFGEEEKERKSYNLASYLIRCRHACQVVQTLP
jgi:hypothetical protein